VGADLGAQAEHEAPARGDLEIPGGVGHGHGAAGEGDGDARRQLHPRGVHRGDAEGEEGLVAVLHGDEAVVAGGLRLARGGGHLDEIVLRQRREDTHGVRAGLGG
jgi:hypothetical protein